MRELENVIERQVIVTRGHKLHFDLPEDNTASAPVSDPPGLVPRSASRPMTEDERQARERANMISALSRSGGKISGPGGAAELLRLKPTTLASRLKRYGIEASQYRAESCS